MHNHGVPGPPAAGDADIAIAVHAGRGECRDIHGRHRLAEAVSSVTWTLGRDLEHAGASSLQGSFRQSGERSLLALSRAIGNDPIH